MAECGVSFPELVVRALGLAGIFLGVIVLYLRKQLVRLMDHLGIDHMDELDELTSGQQEIQYGIDQSTEES